MIVFSADQAAAAIWTFAEDALLQQALELTDDDLRRIWAPAGSHWREDHGLPLESRLTLDKVIAFACIEFLEGQLRSLAQERRRPKKGLPEHLRRARPVPRYTDLARGS